MRIFLSKDVRRAARRVSVSDEDIWAAVLRAESGLIDANLGHGLIKQRIPRLNQGRSGGFRSILFYRQRNVAVFIHLFAKNSQANVGVRQQQNLERLAKEFMKLTTSGFRYFEQSEHWEEIVHDPSGETKFSR